jgi:hypothetical protein
MPDSTNDSNLGSGTSAGMLAFLDWMVQKSYATPASITPLKSAANQIFKTVEAKGGDPNSVDVQTLDVDEYFNRFRVAMQATGRITPDSVRAYKARFVRGLDLYRAYLTTGTVPKVKVRGARPRKEKGATGSARPATASVAAEPASDATPSTNMISYPFPLESGEVASLRLPKRLSRNDASRLSTFINALTFEPQKQIGRGAESDEDLRPMLESV